MAVEGHGGLQAKRVARSQAAGQDAEWPAGLHHFVPYPGAGGLIGGQVDLKSVFSGVAGARDERVGDAANRAPGEPIILDRAQVGLGQLGQRILGPRPLDRELGVVVAVVADVHAGEGAHLGADPLVVLLAGAGVDDQQVVVVAEFVHQDVVDKRSLGIEHGRVLRLARGQLGGIVHGEGLDRRQRARTAELNIAHMADVKEPYAGADRHVLRGNAGVLDRHVPAAEIDHFGSESPVETMESGFAQSGGKETGGADTANSFYREMAYLPR